MDVVSMRCAGLDVHQATVVATSEMEVAILTRKAFSKLIESSPGFSRKLLESLANVVRDLDKKVV